MDLDEKLKLIKKTRDARLKGDGVSRVWDAIDKTEGLTTKEKLEKLISLTRTGPHPKPAKTFLRERGTQPFEVFERQYSPSCRYGRIPVASGLRISGETLALLSRDRAFAGLDLASALFLDLETTGLSGGVGVVPFLTGLAFYREGKFNIVQYLLHELNAEDRMIEELNGFIERMKFESVVSFNGKAFDLPLLETRFILHRKPFPLAELPHLDFLFSARSLWKHKHESCRLFHLSREVLFADRAEDISSAEIPMRYFQYLRTGDFSLIEPILYHNQEDLLSLLGVVIAGALLVSEDRDGDGVADWADGADMFGAARVFEHAGDLKQSVRYLEKALEGRISGEMAVLAKKKLSYILKKNQSWEKAIALWKDLTPANQLFCFKELAMYYEHKEKNYQEARRLAEEGLALSLGVSLEYEEDFLRRLGRLRKKMDRPLKKTKKP